MLVCPLVFKTNVTLKRRWVGSIPTRSRQSQYIHERNLSPRYGKQLTVHIVDGGITCRGYGQD